MERTQLGELLRRHRRASGLTQEGLAEQAGVSARTVSDLERGVHARARAATLERIAEALDLEGFERARLVRAADLERTALAFGPLPPAFRLRSPDDEIFIGRTQACALLADAWRQVRDGSTRVVAIQGEAGIGKSSLTRVWARQCHDDGGILMYGRCDEDAIEPYRPFAEALQTFAAEVPPRALRLLAGDRPGGMQVLMPTLAASASAPQVRDQMTVLEEVRGFLERVSAEAPSVLVLEDLRWADPSSLTMLRHIARRGAGRLLVLATMRLDGQANDDAVRSAVSDLHRLGVLDRLALGGLTVDEVRDLIRELAGIAPPALVELLHRETNGNPLFVRDAVTQLVAADAVRDGRWRSVARDGVAAGEDVELVVDAWLARVPAGTRRLLDVASVIGPVFDAETIARVEGIPAAEVIASLEDPIVRTLVIEGDRTGTWAFRHGIVRAGLYRGIGGASRARLHLLIARELEAGTAPLDVDRLAHHYLRAGAEPAVALRAAGYARTSAERAADVFAWEEAAAGFDLALGALEGGDVLDDRLRCELLVSLGNARTEAFQRHLARPAFLDGARIATNIGASDVLGAAAAGYAYMTKQGDAGAGAVAVWTRALDATRPGATRALVLSALSTAHRLCGDADETRETSLESWREARACGDRTALRVALANRSCALWDSPDVATRVAVADEMLRLTDQWGHDTAELDARSLLVLPLLAAGRIEEFDAQVTAVRDLAVRQRRRFSIAQSLQWVALRALMRGDFDGAVAAADEALDLSGGAPNFTAGHFALQLCVGRLRDADRAVEPWLAGLAEREPAGLTVWKAAVAAAHANAGNVAAALALIRGADVRESERLSWNRVVTLALLAEVAQSAGDVRLARSLEPLLLPYSGSLVVVASGTSCEGAVDRYLALLHVALGDRERARSDLERAIALERRADGTALAARSERELHRLGA